MVLNTHARACVFGKCGNISCGCSCGCSALTGTIGAEVNCEDVVAEACDVVQLGQVSLQRAAGQTGFVERSHKAKHEGVQTGGPTQTYANTTVPLTHI